MTRDLLARLCRFGIVGLTATLVHGLTLYCWVELLGVGPVMANSLAFAVAFIVSYLGHYHWTFEASCGHGRSVMKFLATAIAGFLANVAIMSLVTARLGLHYWFGFALIVATIPLLTYAVSRTWVFADEAG